MDAPCFGCGKPCPRELCTCGERACIDCLGERPRAQELRNWRIYRAGIERGRELERERFAREGVTELYHEYCRLRTRDFWQSVLPEKTLTPRERERFNALGAWLLKNPPRGFAWRCTVCYMGTNCHTRECLACAIC